MKNKKNKKSLIVFGILLFIVILLLFYLIHLIHNRNIQSSTTKRTLNPEVPTNLLTQNNGMKILQRNIQSSTTKKTLNPEFPIFPVLPNQKYYNSLTKPEVPTSLLTEDNRMKIVQRNMIFKDTKIPDNFSWREKLGDKILPVRDQKQCGDCWAFSSTSTLSDRYAVRYNVMAPPLSVLWTITNIDYYLTKNTKPYSCDGKGIYQCLSFFKDIGCKLDSCWPVDEYVSDINAIFPCKFPEPLLLKPSDCCIDDCKNPIASDIYKINNISFLSDIWTSDQSPEEIREEITKNIQIEIMNNGPVVGVYQIFDDFISDNPFKSTYTSRGDKDEIYIRNSNVSNGWHAVEVTGWGTKQIDNSESIRYWEIKNSWGTDVGNNGYFKFAFSIDIPTPDKWCYLDIYDKVTGGGGMYTFSVLECDGCKNIVPLKTMFQKNPVPQNILTDLGNQSEYLILLPGPGTEIVIDLHNDIHWGRVYDNDDGSITDSYIHGCPSKLSCDYVKSYYPSTYCSGRGYIFGTSGSFDLTINVYYQIREIKTGKISNLCHIYYNARCQNLSDPFYVNGEGESRTYGDNFILFPGNRVFQPPQIMICRAPVVIAGI